MSTLQFAPGVPGGFDFGGTAKFSKVVTHALAKGKYSQATALSYGEVYGRGYQWIQTNRKAVYSLVNLGNDELTVYGAYDGAKMLLEMKNVSTALKFANAVGPLQGLVAVLQWRADQIHVELNPCL